MKWICDFHPRREKGLRPSGLDIAKDSVRNLVRRLETIRFAQKIHFELMFLLVGWMPAV